MATAKLMIKKITKKLKSENGASLSFALLLFLVCAAIGGVVLNAGTLSTSKLVDRATMDKRYYEVTSAVEFLKDKFENGEAVVITRTNTNDTSWTFSCNGSDDLSSLFAKALLEDTSDLKKLYDSNFYHSASFENLILHFKSSDGLITHEVNITPNINNGVVILDVKSTDGKYWLKITLSPDIKEVTSKNEGTETKVATIKFIVSDIKKICSNGKAC